MRATLATLIAAAALAAPASAGAAITLSPADATVYRSEGHTVTAAFGADRPPAGTEVRFEVHRHGVVAQTAFVPVDADGRARFTYGYDGLVDDTIRACLGSAAC